MTSHNRETSGPALGPGCAVSHALPPALPPSPRLSLMRSPFSHETFMRSPFSYETCISYVAPLSCEKPLSYVASLACGAACLAKPSAAGAADEARAWALRGSRVAHAGRCCSRRRGRHAEVNPKGPIRLGRSDSDDRLGRSDSDDPTRTIRSKSDDPGRYFRLTIRVADPSRRSESPIRAPRSRRTHERRRRRRRQVRRAGGGGGDSHTKPLSDAKRDSSLSTHLSLSLSYGGAAGTTSGRRRGRRGGRCRGCCTGPASPRPPTAARSAGRRRSVKLFALS